MKFSRLLLAATAAAILFLAARSFGADKSPHYVFTNNDSSGKISNSSNFYTVGAGGLLAEKAIVTTGFGGIAGGYFGLDRVAALRNGKEQCVYVSDALPRQIPGPAPATHR
jgi:hypothetical protein